MPFSDLAERVAEVRERIESAVARGGHGQQVTVVAVTKTYGPDAVASAFDAGLHDVGENRIQEALSKMNDVAVPVRWHLIGHLQRNKAKAVDRFSLVHSVDSGRLADAVNRVGEERGTPVNSLMQVNVSGEAAKGGLSSDEAAKEGARWLGLHGLHVGGVMTMAPMDADERTLRLTFGGAREVRERLVALGHPAAVLSMGMSNDYEIAVEEGATMVRLGTVLFGARSA
ncbi:MAG TPA: YggS family pyridoxal phosphate-dependent enzyme [Gemmatimonadaceae bacterium]|nr:YggS family pyridoxal phosphate-dependent enzyme [Gemmatimonadaceae bacterium]